jgi:NADPH:quinone reductase-like Zn-dependent oxidoreductase
MGSMKAVTFHRPGGPEVLQYEDAPVPEVGPGQVLVRVAAAALNHLDLIVRGRGPNNLPLPHIGGADGAGVVAEIGGPARESVGTYGRTRAPGPKLQVGDQVAINPALSCGACRHCRAGEQSLCASFGILGRDARGTLAEFVVVPAENVYPIPDQALSFVEAAAAPLVMMTAWRMLVTQAQLQAGERVLIVGAGGGVATAAIQIARLLGATVYATTGGPEKVRRACELGADAAIDYQTADVVAAVRQLTNGDGVDVVVDSVGAVTFASSIECLGKGGRLVTCGATTAPLTQLDIRNLWRKQISLHGSTMANDREFRAVMGLLAAGKLRPAVDRVYPLSETRAAQEYLESAGQFGKVVLEVAVTNGTVPSSVPLES